MNNISDHDLQRSVRQYLEDPYLIFVHQQINEILKYALPKYKIIDGKVETIYSDKVNRMLADLQQEVDNRKRYVYPDLFDFG